MSIRDTDSPWDKPPMPPLGHPEPRAKEPAPEWVRDRDNPGIEIHVKTGMRRTCEPLPKGHP